MTDMSGWSRHKGQAPELCIRCGVRPPSPPRRICKECRAIEVAEKRRLKLEADRANPGMCNIDGCQNLRDVTPSQIRSICRAHYREQQKVYLAKARRRKGIPERKIGRTPRDVEKTRATGRRSALKNRVVRDYEGFTSREDYEVKRDVAQCAICGVMHAEVPLVFDHDHQSGRDRDWLCGVHNSMLGFAQDSVEILRAAIAYLEKHA